MFRVALATSLVCLFAVISYGQTKENPRLITVSGTAEVKVNPDVADVTLGVESRNRDIKIAESQTNSAVSALLTIAKQFNIAADDIQTLNLQVEPHFNDSKSGRQLQYYSVSHALVFTLRDPTKAGDFISAAVEAGANDVEAVSFRMSEPRKFADQARQMALKAAKEKAQAVAIELGVALGNVHEVVEQSNGCSWNTSFNSYGYASFQNYAPSSARVAAGQISVSDSFTVSFEIK